MLKPQPVNLNILTLRFPVTAIVSILHRASGFVLFFLLPLLLLALHCSLSSSASFETVHQCITHPLVKTLVWLSGGALIYHLLAGLRHLLMDLDIGETLEGGRRGAWLVIVFSALLFIGLGVQLWR